MKVPQPVALALMLAATTAAIGVGGAPSVATASDRSPSSVSTPTGTNAPAMPLYLHPGKILASNCFQCHGTDGKGGPFDGIAGEPAAELFKELKEYGISLRELRTDTEQRVEHLSRQRAD